jgi:hypothetical protein
VDGEQQRVIAGANRTREDVVNMRNRLWIVAAAVLASSACTGGAEPPPFKPIVDTKLLMEAVLDPQADVIWNSVGTIITASGEENIRPKTEEEWIAVRNAAVAVAESGNLLMMVPRAKDEEWMRISQAMVDTGAKAIKAAEAKDVDQVFDVGGEIYAVCTNCHAKYDPSIASRVN